MMLPVALLLNLVLVAFLPERGEASEIEGVYVSEGEEVAEGSEAVIAPQVVLALKIILKDQVSTAGQRLYLRDIAQCVGHVSVCEELEAVDVGASPEPGRMRVLLRRDVEQTVARETSHAVQVEGPESLRVTTEFREVDAAAIRDAISSRLAGINERLDQVEIRLKQVLPLKRLKIRPVNYDISVPEWDPLLSPFNDEALMIDDEWAAARLSRPMRIVVKIKLEGEERTEEIPVRVHLEAYRYFPVAARSLPRGASITRDDLRIEKRRLGPSSRLWLTDARGLEGKVLRIPLRVGDVPSATMLVTPLVVKRGEIVDLAIQAGGVALQGRGRTLMSGAVGDTIDVLYLATKKQLKGRVVGPSKVEVSF